MKFIRLATLIVLGGMIYSCSPKVATTTSAPTEPKVETRAVSAGAEIVNSYLQAIGGMDKVKMIKDVQTIMEANTGMGSMTMTNYKKGNTMMKMMIEAQGMVVMEQKYDGKRAMLIGMEGSEEVTDQKQLDNFKGQSKIFPELDYANEGYTLELGEPEEYKGNPVKVLIVTTPSGRKMTEYYDTSSGFKVKTKTKAEVQGMEREIVMEFADYKEVDGIKVPHSMTMSGAMPMALQFDVKEVIFNQGLSDEIFMIE